MLKTAEPAPQQNAAAATHTAEACRAIGTSGSAKPNVPMVAMTTGRRGRQPRHSRPAAIAPAPWTPMIAPHTAAPPR